MHIQYRLSAFVGIALATALGCGTAWAQGCKPVHIIQGLVSPGKLTAAIYEYPPFSITTGGNAGGIDGDILKSIAATECLTLVPIVVDPAATIQYVLAGKADVAAGGWYRTAARAKVVGISSPTYLDQMGVYSKDGASTVEALIGKQVGTVSGYLWVPDMQKLLGANLRLYPNPVALAQDLQAGRIQFGVDSYITGTYAQKEKGGYPGITIKVGDADPRVQATTEAGQCGLLYTKTNVSLGNALDEDIEALHKSGKIADYLMSYGLDRSGADTGAGRLMN